jgi:hypothetical protein
MNRRKSDLDEAEGMILGAIMGAPIWILLTVVVIYFVRN